MTIKKSIENYLSVNDNYKKLLKAAYFITKDNTAEDLLNDVILQILNRDEYSEIVKNCSNYYNYIVKAMHIQFNSKTSEYNKKYRRFQCHSWGEENKDEYDFFYEEVYDYVISNKLFKNNLKDFVYKKIFLDYFYSEYNFNLEGLDKKEVDKIRKMSYQKIADNYDISKDSVRRAIKSVIQKIKLNYEKK